MPAPPPRQAGAPIGDQGQDLGRVDDLYAWAQRTGRAIPNGPGVVPQTGARDALGYVRLG